MFDLVTLRQAVADHGRVARVVIAAIRGSSPREVGAAMIVWAKDGTDSTGGAAADQTGTIGGGALEYEAARKSLNQKDAIRATTHALGPELGQCCGGSVTLVTEIWDAARLEDLITDDDQTVIARPVVDGNAGADKPLSVHRVLNEARAKGDTPTAQLVDGWMVEPVYRPTRKLWIWGAGHVGRALVHTLSPLPEFDITWIDTGAERFPDVVPAGVTVLPAADPALLVAHAPRDAEHLILTYSHALDFELCHRLLGHGFRFAGVIGSATKWARFKSRLKNLGHSEGDVSKLTCPIGNPALGKHPQSIAVGVATQLLTMQQTAVTANTTTPNNKTNLTGKKIRGDRCDTTASEHSGADQSLSRRGGE